MDWETIWDEVHRHDIHAFCLVGHRAYVCGQLPHNGRPPPGKRLGADIAFHMRLFAFAADLFLCPHRFVINAMRRER